MHLAVIKTFYKDGAVINQPIDEDKSDSEVDFSDEIEPDCKTDEESDEEGEELDTTEKEIRTKYADLIPRVRKVSVYSKNCAKAMHYKEDTPS